MSAELAAELASNAPRILRVEPRREPLRFHNLKAMGRSGKHCFESFQYNGESTLSMRLGAGGHALLFGQPVAVFDRPAKKGKGKAPRNGEQWETFKAENPGKLILNRKEYDKAEQIATAILSHRDAHDLLFAPGSIHERTILWTQAGRDRRSTPDCRRPGHVVELKTTRCAKPEQFRWDVRKMCYHAQLVDQAKAIEAETGKRPDEMFIVAVENTKPWVVQTYRLTPRDLELGERLLCAWFELYRVAEESNAWCGYAEGTIDLDLPDDDDFEISFGDDEDSKGSEDDE